jgi:MarR family transcriptional regulator for hemolysin
MEQTLGRLLFLSHRAVHDELDRRLQEHDASVWSWVLLREAANADGASQRELAELMRIEPPTLVRHLDRMAEEGLVERRPDTADRRIVRVAVTEAGRSRLAKLHEIVHELETELRASLSAREVDVLGSALLRIHDHFMATDAKEAAHAPS